MPDFDDSLGGQTLGDDNNEDRFDKSLGDERNLGDANLEDEYGVMKYGLDVASHNFSQGQQWYQINE